VGVLADLLAEEIYADCLPGLIASIRADLSIMK
jgi:hypothetical protein